MKGFETYAHDGIRQLELARFSAIRGEFTEAEKFADVAVTAAHILRAAIREELYAARCMLTCPIRVSESGVPSIVQRIRFDLTGFDPIAIVTLFNGRTVRALLFGLFDDQWPRLSDWYHPSDEQYAAVERLIETFPVQALINNSISDTRGGK